MHPRYVPFVRPLAPSIFLGSVRMCTTATIEAKLREYEHALDNAATLYHQIGQLITTQSNDYTRDVMTRFTTATIIIQYLEPYSAEMRLLISL